MKTLPELNEDAIIELAREGGFAFIPKLAGLRRFALASVTSSERERICNAIRNAFPQARDPVNQTARRGDQFYYRIHISYRHPQQNQYADVVLLIPEDRAPPELTELWRNGAQE